MKKIKILIVDDEKDFAEALAERLELRGLEAEVRTDGEAALAFISETPPDVVILDIKMPGIDGFEVLRRIKASHPQLPVILLTGHSSIKDGIRGMELGANDYLLKPINIQELITKVEAAVAAS